MESRADHAGVGLIAAALGAFRTDQTSSSPLYTEGTRGDQREQHL